MRSLPPCTLYRVGDADIQVGLIYLSAILYLLGGRPDFEHEMKKGWRRFEA